MYSEPTAWRAVGITRAALAAYSDAGHLPLKGIERAHLVDRSEMVATIFGRDEPFDEAQLFYYWSKTDRVVIALKSENRRNDLGDWVPFDNDDGAFFTRLGIGFRYRPDVEGALTRRLATTSI